jgi:DNA-binding transcriptional MerR regulator
MERLWTVADVAEYLGIPVKTLYDWRTRDYGPSGKRVGKYLRYKAQDVIAWFDALDVDAA